MLHDLSLTRWTVHLPESLWSRRRSHEVDIWKFPSCSNSKDKYCSVFDQLPGKQRHQHLSEIPTLSYITFWMLFLETSPWLFKKWTMLSTRLITIQWIAWFVLWSLIHWIALSSLQTGARLFILNIEHAWSTAKKTVPITQHHIRINC